jgi:putative tricarboxylic transport membrane protein
MDSSHRRLPGELVFVLILLLVGLVALWQAWRISGLASWSSPGAVPMFAALVMVVAGAKIVRDTRRVPGPDTSTDAPPASRFFHAITPAVVIWFTLLIVFYMFALEPLGFIVSSFLFLVASMFALGERRVLYSALVSAISLAVIYVIFQTAFSVVLPDGVLRGVFK